MPDKRVPDSRGCTVIDVSSIIHATHVHMEGRMNSVSFRPRNNVHDRVHQTVSGNEM